MMRSKVGGYVGLNLQPITFKEAAAFVNDHHRHHIAPVGHKYSIALNDGEKVVGVIIIGRPVPGLTMTAKPLK